MSQTLSAADAELLLAVEYVIGTLEGEERKRAKALIADDPRFAHLVRRWEALLVPLHELAAPVVPPPDLWRAIQKDLPNDIPVPRPFVFMENMPPRGAGPAGASSPGAQGPPGGIPARTAAGASDSGRTEPATGPDAAARGPARPGPPVRGGVADAGPADPLRRAGAASRLTGFRRTPAPSPRGADAPEGLSLSPASPPGAGGLPDLSQEANALAAVGPSELRRPALLESGLLPEAVPPVSASEPDAAAVPSAEVAGSDAAKSSGPSAEETPRAPVRPSRKLFFRLPFPRRGGRRVAPREEAESEAAMPRAEPSPLAAERHPAAVAARPAPLPAPGVLAATVLALPKPEAAASAALLRAGEPVAEVAPAPAEAPFDVQPGEIAGASSAEAPVARGLPDPSAPTLGSETTDVAGASAEVIAAASGATPDVSEAPAGGGEDLRPQSEDAPAQPAGLDPADAAELAEDAPAQPALFDRTAAVEPVEGAAPSSDGDVAADAGPPDWSRPQPPFIEGGPFGLLAADVEGTASPPAALVEDVAAEAVAGDVVSLAVPAETTPQDTAFLEPASIATEPPAEADSAPATGDESAIASGSAPDEPVAADTASPGTAPVEARAMDGGPPDQSSSAPPAAGDAAETSTGDASAADETPPVMPLSGLAPGDSQPENPEPEAPAGPGEILLGGQAADGAPQPEMPDAPVATEEPASPAIDGTMPEPDEASGDAAGLAHTLDVAGADFAANIEPAADADTGVWRDGAIATGMAPASATSAAEVGSDGLSEAGLLEGEAARFSAEPAPEQVPQSADSTAADETAGAAEPDVAGADFAANIEPAADAGTGVWRDGAIATGMGPASATSAAEAGSDGLSEAGLLEGEAARFSAERAPAQVSDHSASTTADKTAGPAAPAADTPPPVPAGPSGDGPYGPTSAAGEGAPIDPVPFEAPFPAHTPEPVPSPALPDEAAPDRALAPVAAAIADAVADPGLLAATSVALECPPISLPSEPLMAPRPRASVAGGRAAPSRGWQALAAGLFALLLGAAGGFLAYRLFGPAGEAKLLALLQKEPAPVVALRFDPASGMLTVHALAPPPPSGKSHYLWLLDGEEAHFLGAFAAAAVMQSDALKALDAAALREAQVRVTLEDDGAPAAGGPKGEVLYSGRFQLEVP